MPNQHYTDFLLEDIAQKKKKNPRYSERAYARAIGLSPGFLKLLLQKKRSLSLERAKKIVMNVSWPNQKKYGFLDLLANQPTEKAKPSAKIFSYLFPARERFYLGEGSLTRLADGRQIPFVMTTRIGRSGSGKSAARTILTRYVYADGMTYDLDLQLCESGTSTFLVQAHGRKAGHGFFVGKICHVDLDYVHPQLGPFHASVSYCFTGTRIEATGRNYTSNTTFHQVSKAQRLTPRAKAAVS